MQAVCDNWSVCMLNLLLEVNTLQSLVTISLAKVEICHVTLCWLYRWELESVRCLVWCPWILFKWRLNIFNLSCYLTRPHDRGVVQVFWWNLLGVCHQCHKFGDHRDCERFWFVIWSHITLFLKNDVSLQVEATHGKSPPFHICPLV